MGTRFGRPTSRRRRERAARRGESAGFSGNRAGNRAVPNEDRSVPVRNAGKRAGREPAQRSSSHNGRSRTRAATRLFYYRGEPWTPSDEPRAVDWKALRFDVVRDGAKKKLSLAEVTAPELQALIDKVNAKTSAEDNEPTDTERALRGDRPFASRTRGVSRRIASRLMGLSRGSAARTVGARVCYPCRQSNAAHGRRSAQPIGRHRVRPGRENRVDERYGQVCPGDLRVLQRPTEQ